MLCYVMFGFGYGFGFGFGFGVGLGWFGLVGFGFGFEFGFGVRLGWFGLVWFGWMIGWLLPSKENEKEHFHSMQLVTLQSTFI
jgi:hypothetical protein